MPDSIPARWKSVHGFKVACPEEIAFRMGFTDESQLSRRIHLLGKSAWGQYLQSAVARL